MTVNGFWLGEGLDELSKYCISTWIKNGYEFHLWNYDNIQLPNVVSRDAAEIISKKEYFTYDGGHSAGTPVAFSNLFRAELLDKIGGLYVDLDLICIKPYRFEENKFVFSRQYHSSYSYSVASCIIYSSKPGDKIFKDWSQSIRALKQKNIRHGDLGPDLLTKLIKAHNYQQFVHRKSKFCPADWENFDEIFQKKFYSNSLHVYRSMWKENFEKVQILKEYYGE